MVYFLVSNKGIKYPSGKRSRIIYIGTTKRGSERPATSAAEKAIKAFMGLRGVKNVDLHIFTCQGRKHVKTWLALESAFLAIFWERYFSLPHFNRKKGKDVDTDQVTLFRSARLRSVIRQFEE
jgi:hypothetical protein